MGNAYFFEEDRGPMAKNLHVDFSCSCTGDSGLSILILRLGERVHLIGGGRAYGEGSDVRDVVLGEVTGVSFCLLCV